MCPGVTFALQILHLILARLIHGFELGTVSDKPVDMTESPALTLPKATPLEVTVTPRIRICPGISFAASSPALSIGSATIFVVTILVKGKQKRRRRPPEPAGALPFLGHLHLLGKHQLLHRTFGDMADQYGPAFLVRLGIHQALVVSNSEVAKECFTTNDRVFPTRPKSLVIKLLGYDHGMLGFAPC
ncbi:Cytochrome P450 - like 10 [Theobroma cacao]|nr:Cytochrome P450 - like 10 [Theobroma cacao]